MGKEEPDWHGHQQGNMCGCLKVSLDGVGLETCFFLPVPRAHRSQSGAKNKAQKSPTAQGCLLLEPEIPLMNETAHHNIHVLSKLLAKRR